MISAIWFLLKMSVFTLAVVTALQIRIGDKSVDGHLTYWIQKHKWEQKAQKVFHTHTQFVRRAWNKTSTRVQSEVEDQKQTL